MKLKKKKHEIILELIKHFDITTQEEMLSKLQYIIEHSINDNKQQYGSLISGLEEVLSVVNNNRHELNAKDEPVQEQETTKQN